MRSNRMALFWCLLLVVASAYAETNADFTRTEDVIYGRKFGTALTLDVFQPPSANGAAIILIISGGWHSSHDNISSQRCQPFLKRGYTVFAVVHGSQPKFIATEIAQDIHRAVRFIRHDAAKYGVDPNRFGIIGLSAGGHLSLTIGTQGGPGDAAAKDSVDRESSAVQCVACFYPAADFLNFSKPGEDAVGIGRMAQFKSGFGPLSDSPEGRQKLGRELSPIYFVHSNMPPLLIIHGDADKLVPIYQSQMFVKRCGEVGSEAKLEVREGKGHGWPDMAKDLEVCADWFDKHLRGVESKR